MARRKELRHPRLISLVVEEEVYERYQSMLPRKKSFAEAVREILNSAVEENSVMEGIYTEEEKQSSLDVFTQLDVEDVKDFVNKADRKGLNHIRVLGEQMVQISRTKLREVNKDLQI